MQQEVPGQGGAGCEDLRDTSPTLGCLSVASASTTSPRSEDARLGGVAISPCSCPAREVGQGVNNGSAEHVVGGPAANCPVAVEGPTVQSQHGSRLADFQELRKDGVKRSLDLVSSDRIRHRDRSEAGKGTADVEARRHPGNEPDCPSRSVGRRGRQASNRILVIVTGNVPQRVPTVQSDLPATASGGSWPCPVIRPRDQPPTVSRPTWLTAPYRERKYLLRPDTYVCRMPECETPRLVPSRLSHMGMQRPKLAHYASPDPSPYTDRGRNVWHRRSSRVPNLGENREETVLRSSELREDECLQRRRASTQTLAIVIGYSPRQLSTEHSARLLLTLCLPSADKTTRPTSFHTATSRSLVF